VVAPANASALVRQWIDIHQVDEAGATQDAVDGQTRMSWRDSSGAVVVEHYAIDGICAMVNSYPSDREIASPRRRDKALARRPLRRASMKDKTVAILESRVPNHIASLVRKYGGKPFSAPALAEIPDVDPAHIHALIRYWNSTPPGIFIFQTGVGTRALFAATDSLGLTGVLLRILGAAQVVVRGPTPATVLRSRKVRIDRAASDPFTTQEVLAEMPETPLRGKRVVVQRYGETNR
jgi:Uroporphyrinogen-III synthase HemD